MKRRTALHAICAAAVLAAAPAFAADTRPIRLLVGFPAGGSSDVIARVLAQGLQKELGRNVVVENRAGAGGQIAAQALKSAAPDGTTLFMSNSHSVAMIPLTVRNPGFDTPKDFIPVALNAINPDVLAVNPEVIGNPKAGLKEFAAWAKANPGKANVGVPAPASAPDFAVGVVGKALDVELKSVPYRGDAPVVQDLLAGQIPAGIGSVGAMLQHVQAGKLRLVAVNGTSRLPYLPDVPTYLEQGIKGYEDVIFNGVFAPAGTPAELVKTYAEAIARVVKSPEYTERLEGLNIVPIYGDAAELSARMKSTTEAWTTMVKNAGFQPQ